MPHAATLPLIAGLSIAGAALGLTLGRSAIAEIDPAYFRDPEVPFHADLAANRSPDWAQVQAAEYQQLGLQQEVVECADCAVPAAGYALLRAPPPTEYREAAWTPPEPHYEEEAKPLAEAERLVDPEMERLQRYASYTVAEEAEQPTPAEEEGSIGTQ
ncbi:MAG TPA: hypothetical protein VGB59_07130 [Allosphingosinicella sp.]|jgi:hypothetical protein